MGNNDHLLKLDKDLLNKLTHQPQYLLRPHISRPNTRDKTVKKGQALAPAKFLY